MSTPIPQDVMKAAEIDAREAVRDAMIDRLMPMQFHIARYIARAVMREREAADERAADLMDALMRIHQWCEAYPVDVFPEPDFKRTRQLLAAGGISIDAVSASNMRHVANGIKSIAASAIRDRTKP